jgi:hypothetical protein
LLEGGQPLYASPMSRGEPVPDDHTSRRTEGPTPAGGAYAVAYFSHDGRPVPQRFANQAMIVEYDEADTEIMRTLGTMTPQAVLPPNYAADADAPAPPNGIDLFSLGASLGRIRLSPRERLVTDGPPLTTQAVCLARAYVVDAPGRANLALAMSRAVELLGAHEDLDDRWIAVRFGDRLFYMQVRRDGAGRAASQLPAGVDEQDVIEHDLGPDLRQATDRLQEVCDRLAAEPAEPAETTREEGELALRLARNALRSEDVARDLWRELRERAQRFVDHFEHHPVSAIPVDLTREALAGLRSDFEEARTHLLLDALVTAAARVVEGVALTVADAKRERDFDGDAHLRALYHRFNLALARGPATDEPALHLVAAALTDTALDEGFASEVETLARLELQAADELVALALDVPEDLDGFYWLLFSATLPLHAAEILYRVLASRETVPGLHARLASLSEEKRVRVSTSVLEDARDLYTPLLVDERNRVQEKLRDEGQLRARQEAINVIDHALKFPRWVEHYLLAEDAREEDYWEELMAERRPLKSAPVWPGT